jgi:hypothetical protein
MQAETVGPAPTSTDDLVIDLRDSPQNAPVSARTLERMRWVGLVLLVVLNIGDLVTTKMALHGGAIEGNPFSSMLISHGAINPAKFLTLAVLAWCISRTPPRLFSTVAVWFVAGVYTMVIASNLLVYANTI